MASQRTMKPASYSPWTILIFCHVHPPITVSPAALCESTLSQKMPPILSVQWNDRSSNGIQDTIVTPSETAKPIAAEMANTGIMLFVLILMFVLFIRR